MTDRFGPRPTYADLPVAELAVDSSYQRSIEARRNQLAIERICENFRWSLFGIVTVTKGLTGYLIIDGQHRTEAARRLKLNMVPCLIVPPLSKKDQALAFVAANRDRVAVTQFAIHHALAAAGDPKATALQTMCEAAGIEIPRYPIPSSGMKPGQTLAIGALGGLLDTLGHDRAVILLHAVRGAFADERAALRAPLISALSALDAEMPLDAAALMRALAHKGLKEFEKECAVLLLDGGNSKTRTLAAVTVISRLIGRDTAPPATSAPSPAAAVAAPPAVAKPAPAPAKPAPKPYRPIPVSDGRATKKVGPSRAEIDSAITSFVSSKGVTKCPPAAVAPTTADPGSKFDHIVMTEAQRRARQASGV